MSLVGLPGGAVAGSLMIALPRTESPRGYDLPRRDSAVESAAIDASAESRLTTALKQRILHFPQNQSIGQVRLWSAPLDGPLPLHPRRADIEYAECAAEQLGQAQGDVVVPVGRAVVLQVDHAEKLDLSCLSTLAPDDLHMLMISSSRRVPRADERILGHIPHLAGLRILFLAHTGITARGLHALKDMRSLRGLVLHEESIGDSGLAALPALPSLEWFECEVGATDRGLKHLAEFGNLQVLRLQIDKIRGPGLASLAALSSLEHLCLLGQSGPRDNHVRNLESVTQLKNLTLWGGPGLTNNALASIGKLTALETLTFIHVPGLTDDGVVHLRDLKHLKYVEFRGSWIGDGGIRTLATLPQLEAIVCVSPGPEGMALLGHCDGLRVLDLSLRPLKSGGPAESGLNHLTPLKSLEELGITGLQIKDDDLKHLESLASLRRLTILGQSLTNAGMVPLSNLRQLESLKLYMVHVTIRGLNQLNSLTNLRSLSVKTHPQTRPDHDATLDLSGLRNLEKLTLRNCNFVLQDHDLVFLSSLTNLEWLDLAVMGRQPVSSDALKYVRGLTKLDYLRLPWMDLTTGDDLRNLQDLHSLKQLHLSGRITDRALSKLRGPPCLGILSIRTTEFIGAKTLRHLRESLPSGCRLDIRRAGQRHSAGTGQAAPAPRPRTIAPKQGRQLLRGGSSPALWVDGLPPFW